MRAARPTLHLNLSRSNFGQPEDVEMGAGMGALGSPAPQTPLGQVAFTPTSQPGSYMQRFNSVSSSATAWSDDQSEDVSLPMNKYTDTFWSQEDDDLLLTIYQEYIDNPTAAPFAGRIPPSGVVHKVAQSTSKTARVEGRNFPHSLSSIRKRLLLLCNRTFSETAPPPRVGSAGPISRSASPLTSAGLGTSLEEQLQCMTPRRSESPENGFLMPNANVAPRLGTWMWSQQQQHHYQNMALGGGVAALSPAATPEKPHPLDRPLASPFCDKSYNNPSNAANTTNSTTENTLHHPSPERRFPMDPLDPLQPELDENQTSRRKRISLNMKRGIK